MEHHEAMERIRRSSIPQDYDLLIPSLKEWIEYRGMVARQIIFTSDPDRMSDLLTIYDHAEKNIKQILGL